MHTHAYTYIHMHAYTCSPGGEVGTLKATVGPVVITAVGIGVDKGLGGRKVGGVGNTVGMLDGRAATTVGTRVGGAVGTPNDCGGAVVAGGNVGTANATGNAVGTPNAAVDCNNKT